MLLKELVGVKKYQELALEDLIEAFMKESGYTKMGSGVFSYVFNIHQKTKF